MEEIVDLLSPKHLEKYNHMPLKDAVQCHLYNCELAESFYSSLSYFEIILRNKIDKVFSKYLGEDWIFNPEYHICKNKNHYEDTLKRIEREKDCSYLKNRDCIISELTFGYWSFLFSSAYNELIWKKYPAILSEIFDNPKFCITLPLAYFYINRIRLYRNKVFHYGSLIVQGENMVRPEQIHNMIYSMCSSLGAKKLLKQIREIDTFNEKYQKGKKLRILK